MIRKLIALAMVAVFSSATVIAQSTSTRGTRPVKYLIAAVLNDGRMLEPIAYIQEGKLLPPANGSDDPNIIAAFTKAYYPKGKAYTLYFGGKAAGTVTVTAADPKAECTANMADVLTKTTRTPLKGNVMALASNAPLKKPGSGVRRMPTTAERQEIEVLVRADFAKNNVAANHTKTLKYQNLTALDVDADGKAEMVGSYWVETGTKSRALLAFIAEKDEAGKYVFGWSNFSSYTDSEVMSGDVTDLDSGVYHERLLDVYDVDGDGVSEIFTYIMSFEGAGFNVYRRQGGKWVQSFDGSNYHCAY